MTMSMAMMQQRHGDDDEDEDDYDDDDDDHGDIHGEHVDDDNAPHTTSHHTTPHCTIATHCVVLPTSREHVRCAMIHRWTARR